MEMNEFWRVIGFGIGALVLSACGASSPAPDDLVGQFRSGAMMCIRPSVEGKRCNTIARYTFLPDGSLRAETAVTMSKSVVMSMVAPASIRGDAVCHTGRAVDVSTATFVVLGHPATEQETAALREQVKANIAARPPQELCLTIAMRAGRLMVDATINGTPQPEQSQPMIWVQPRDGYSASPA